MVAKKKSRAELALSVISTRKRRTLSAVTVSGDRPRNLANIACLADIVLLGLSAELADRHVVQHAAPNVTDARFADWGVLAVEVGNPFDPQDGALSRHLIPSGPLPLPTHGPCAQRSPAVAGSFLGTKVEWVGAVAGGPEQGGKRKLDEAPCSRGFSSDPDPNSEHGAFRRSSVSLSIRLVHCALGSLSATLFAFSIPVGQP